MEKLAALSLLGTGIASILLVAGYALACWRADSRSTPKRKSPAEPSTPISDERYAKLQAEMAELYSTLESLTTTVKRISSRQALRDRQEKGTDPDELPVGTPKEILRKKYATQIALAATGGVARE